MKTIPEQPTDCSPRTCGQCFKQSDSRAYFCTVNGKVCHVYEYELEAAAERDIESRNERETARTIAAIDRDVCRGRGT